MRPSDYTAFVMSVFLVGRVFHFNNNYSFRHASRKWFLCTGVGKKKWREKEPQNRYFSERIHAGSVIYISSFDGRFGERVERIEVNALRFLRSVIAAKSPLTALQAVKNIRKSSLPSGRQLRFRYLVPDGNRSDNRLRDSFRIQLRCTELSSAART